MKKEIPAWLQELHGLLKEVESNLKKQRWFKEGWKTQVYYFPSESSPEWACMHLFKKHWFNDERQGIHFEVGFGPADKNARDLKIVLHMHPKLIPGTTVKRQTVIGEFLEQARPHFKTLPGFKLRTGWGGTESISIRTKSSKETLVEDLTAEFCRLQPLGALLDQALALTPGARKKI